MQNNCNIKYKCLWNKLPPMLILKGKTGKKETELNNLDIVKDKKIYIKCQANSWCTAELFKYWIKKIFIPYQDNIVKNRCLLIFDRLLHI